MSILSNNVENKYLDFVSGSLFTLGGAVTTVCGTLLTLDTIQFGISGLAVKILQTKDFVAITGLALTIYEAAKVIFSSMDHALDDRQSITLFAFTYASILGLSHITDKGNRFAAAALATYAFSLSLGILYIGVHSMYKGFDYLYRGINGIHDPVIPNAVVVVEEPVIVNNPL